ncbi:MAG TPA: glycosyl hydrolase family 28 protein [Bryobacteraceae bacterium]|jgi:polygalacturonase|nr:glycosyl hydrolase family 28 protein [Bryobacteraceae bacterium]
MVKRTHVFAAAAGAFALQAVWAQDTRMVNEPVIPAACIALTAKIGRAGSSIAFEDETKLDTGRIQAAIDHCAAGKAVVLKRASARVDAFLSGPLELRSGVTLVVDRGAYLFASRNPRDYDRKPGVCGTITEDGHGCKALINGNGANDAGIMGDGVIDGRGGETMLRRNISWWNLADRARKGGSQNNPRLMVLDHCNNFVLYRIKLMNSPNFHVGYENGNGFTAWGVKIWAPERARNTDGIDPGNSENVTIAHSFIHTGDDQVAIKAPAGAPTGHMSIVHNHFYSGHGMSIGSTTDGGASAIRVTDLSIDGADNGLRIKSNPTRGGLVHDVVFEDVCIRNTENPIFMDTSYSAHASKTSGLLPVFRDIVLRNVRVEGVGKITLEGYDAAHRLGIQFDGVEFDDAQAIQVSAMHADVKVGPGPFNLGVAGEDVTVSGRAGPGSENACGGKFVGFPME